MSPSPHPAEDRRGERRRTMKKVLTAAATAVLLVGCGGGSPTTPTPPPQAELLARATSPIAIEATLTGGPPTREYKVSAGCWQYDAAGTKVGWIRSTPEIREVGSTDPNNPIVLVELTLHDYDRSPPAGCGGRTRTVRAEYGGSEPLTVQVTLPPPPG